MILSFDKFERYEMPQVTLCNPNSRATEVDGKIIITDTVGVLSNPKGMNLKLNFNAPHELSFDYYRHKTTDPIKQSFYDSIYESIQTDRYIYLTDIGYFIISSVTDSDEDNIDKKSITCKSCEENELATAEGLYLEEGTYYLHTENNDGLIDLFLPKTAGWTIGFIDSSLLLKPYFVEETEVDNGYNFLYTTVQDMFECIIEPDIIARTISVYSRVYYAEHHLTDIHIAKYNLLKHKTVEENDEDKYTALNVQGKDENLEIRTVNPTGKNVIYNFEPRYSWMSPALQQAIEKWQEKCESVEDEYLALQQGYYDELGKLFNEEKDIEILKGELERLKETKDIAFTMADGDEKDQSLNNVNKAITAKQEEINIATSNYNSHKATVQITYEIPISQINSDCALDITAKDINGNAIFTVDLLNELMTHIKPTEYIDEYMLVTESMTYPQRFEKAKELMDRAQSQLVKISSGQKTYSIDTRSFLFNKQFKHFSEQLCAGAIIYIETKKDTMEQLHLTDIDINFDEKSTNFTLGNKYDRSDLKALYDDALGKNSKSFSELKYIASIIEDQQKQLDYQRNWVADLRTLTLDNVLTSEDQAIEINNRGLIGRKRQLNEDGSWKFDENGNPLFELEQVKLINNTLVFTKDNWNTASTAVGKIAVGYDAKGNVKYAYGINGQVLIGELILGNNLVLTGTGAGIKIKNSNGEDVFYADDNGNLVLSSTIFAKNGEIGGWNIGATLLSSKFITDVIDGGAVGIATGINTTDYSISQVKTGGGQEGLCFWAGATYKANHTDKGHVAISEAPFRVYNNGSLYASNAVINGTISATKGTIGGWTIDDIKLYTPCVWGSNGIDKYGTGMAATGWGIDPAFYAGFGGNRGNPWAHNANLDSNGNIINGPWQNYTSFYVTNVGYLCAKNANIKGHIEADSGTFNGTITAINGHIGGCTIDNAGIYSGSGSNTAGIGLANHRYAFWAGGSLTDAVNGTAAFTVGHNGKLIANDAVIRGDITADSGKIGGWHIQSGHLLGYIDKNNYVSMWSPSPSENSFINLKHNGAYTFYVEANGHLYANNATIRGHIEATSGSFSGTIKAGTILQNGVQVGSSKYTRFDDWTYANYYGTRWKLSNSNVYVGLTPDIITLSVSGGASLDLYKSGSIIANGTNNSSTIVTSDEKKKNSISNLEDNYNVLFDNLLPVKYKYNDGTSNRYHTGFIAQRVKEALDKSNLTTQDFAGFSIWKPDTEDELWGLRYEEFIALNTWQIQRCKKRITDLENTVAELKTQIQTLTAG